MVYRTSNSLKMFYRDAYRRYFEAQEPDNIAYLYNVVVSLWNNPEVNNLKTILGEKEYAQIDENLRRFQRLYSFAAQIRKNISEMEAKKYHSENISQLIHIQNNTLKAISIDFPLIREDIIQAFFLITSNTDLKDLPVPKKEQIRPQPQMQSQTTGQQSYY